MERQTTTDSPGISYRIAFLLVGIILSCLLVASNAFTQVDTLPADSIISIPIAPATSLVVSDHKYDDGDRLDLNWVPSIDDRIPGGSVLGYVLYKSTNGREAEIRAQLLPGVASMADDNVFKDSLYVYYLAAYSATDTAYSVHSEAITPQREWINMSYKWLFLIGLIISLAVIYYISHAKRGTKLFVRKIAGLDAVDDAIGRATEMGRPILFIPGILDMDDVQTIAGLTILGRVAKQIAEYDTKIRMPVSRSLVMTAARETIKAAYQTAGRPDAYNDDMVNYVTDEQFGYVAAVDGIMVREKPATTFLLGAFFAESLILAETGNSIGAIQIAGTARPAQLPFFIAACDFTLIGEELFAASAYLSGEPKQLGSLKGQDVGKAIAMLAIILGVISVTLGEAFDIEFFQSITDGLMEVFSIPK